MTAATDTSAEILRCAKTLIIVGGYNGFSYADIAAVVGIRKASIHHHFPTKVDLVRALLQQYRQDVDAGIAEFERQSANPADQLRAYIGYWETCVGDPTASYCVCALLASQMPVLPAAIAAELQAYFRTLSDWLTSLLDRGAKRGAIALSGDARVEAETFMATVHGAMLAARAYGDPSAFGMITRPLVDRLATGRCSRAQRCAKQYPPPSKKETPMTGTAVLAPTAAEVRQWLHSYYLLRAAVAGVWVAAAFMFGTSFFAVGAVLLVLYPAWDAFANVVDAQRNAGLKHNPIQAVNVVVSAVTTAAVAIALGVGMNAVIGVFGVWATLAGLLQLAVGVRRWKAYGAQWAMVLSGAQSALVGGLFLKQAFASAVPSVADIAPYAGFGAFYFLVSALWLGASEARRRRVPAVPIS